MIILWIISVLSSVYGAIEFIISMSAAQSAPQQAAGAAMCLCYVIIPYCIARAVSSIQRDAQLAKIVALLEKKDQQAP
jgi:hypothetical protein